MTRYARLTIDDIARLAGVSRTTASMVLNGRAAQYRIATATAERVIAVAQEHHFEPSHPARALRSGASRTIGLIVPELTNFAHASLAEAIEPRCHAAGYQLLVATSGDDPAHEQIAIGHLFARHVDGLVIAPCTAHAEAYAEWRKRLPIFLVDRKLNDPALPYAITDAAGAVAALVADALRGGPGEAFYFGGQPEFSPSVHRLQGFTEALRQAGLTEQPGWVRARDYTRASGYMLMKHCFNELGGRYPDVLFTGALTLLEGVLAFIGEHAHFDRAPRRIVTFDDHALLDCIPLCIDSIEQDTTALAQASVDGILGLIGGRAVASETVAARLHWRSRKAPLQNPATAPVLTPPADCDAP